MTKFLAGLAFIVIGGFAAYYAQPAVKQNADLVLIIVTVFTVFAGFLIAIITIIGDPALIKEGSWRIAEAGRDPMQRRLFFHVVLFTLYLATIALLFMGVVLDKTLDPHNETHELIRLWVERGYLFVGVTSFLFTFMLPAALLQMQQARYDAEIERRRREHGIQD